MAITFLDEEPTGRKITFLDEETQKPVGTSIGQEISQLPAALKQSFGQPLEAMGETAQVAGFPAVGAALKGAIQEPQGYVSAGQRFMEPQEGEFQIAGFAPQYAPRAVAEQTGQILYSIGSRIVGKFIGRGLGGLLGPTGGAIGGAAGELVGPAAFAAAQVVGPVALERAKNNGYTEPTDEDMAYAISTAAVSGALDSFATRFLPGGKEAVGPFFKRLGASFLGQSVPEGLQSFAEQIGGTIETKKGIQVSPKKAVGEALIGGGAGAVATTIAAPFTPEQIAEAKITESANKEAENLVIGNDNPQGKAVLANKQKLEQEIADAKQVLSVIESTDPVAQKLKLELKEKEAILAAAQGQVDSIVDSNEPVVEAERQQIELAKAITAPVAPAPEVAAPVTEAITPAAPAVPAAEVAPAIKEVRNIEEASQETGVPQERILTAAQNGEIEAVKVGKNWRFGQRAINEIKTKVAPTEVAPPTEPTIKESLPVAPEAPAITPATTPTEPATTEDIIGKKVTDSMGALPQKAGKARQALQGYIPIFKIGDFYEFIGEDAALSGSTIVGSGKSARSSLPYHQTSKFQEIANKTGKPIAIISNTKVSEVINPITPAPVAETPAVTEAPAAKQALPKAIIQRLLKDGVEIIPSGNQYSGFRQLVMEKLGKPSPKSKSGTNAVKKELIQYLGVDTNDTIAGIDNSIRSKLRQMLENITAPTPAVSETITPAAEVAPANPPKVNEVIAVDRKNNTEFALVKGLLPERPDMFSIGIRLIGSTQPFESGGYGHNTNKDRIMQRFFEKERTRLQDIEVKNQYFKNILSEEEAKVSEIETQKAAEKIAQEEQKRVFNDQKSSYEEAISKVKLPTGKSETMRFTAPDGSEQALDSTRYGNIGIRKVTSGKKPLYNVDHWHSGLRITQVASLSEAKKLAQAIIASGADISSKDIKESELEKMRPVVRYFVRGESVPQLPTPAAPAVEPAGKPEDKRYNPLGYDIADVVEDVKAGKTDTPLRAINQVVDQASQFRDRVKAESERRQQPRKRGKAAILERVARERSAGNITEKTAQALTDFVNRIREDAIGDTAISIREKGVSNFDFADNLVTFFLNQDKGNLGREVAVHEFWHGLSRFLPEAEVEQINKDYVRELEAYLKKNPWFLAFVGRYTLTPEQYEAYKFFNPKEAETKLTPILDDRGNIIKYKIKFDKDNYRYIMLDEFIAEKMTDLVIGKQAIPDTFLGKLAKAFREFLALIKTKLGIDPYEKFYQLATDTNERLTLQRESGVAPPIQIYEPQEYDYSTRRAMAVEPTPIEPEAKTITEGLVQGIDIGKENNMPINNKIESHIKNFAFVRGIFESASDRLRRAKFTKLATAIDDYYDQAQRRLGFANKILLPAFDEYSKQSKATKKKIDEEVKRFFAAQENKRDTAEFFDELNPITQKIVTAWQKFGEESGSENQRIGIKVFDKGLQRWRPIGKVEKFWPRVLKPEYKRALMEPDKYQKEYNEIVDALMKSGRIQTPEEAEVFISDYQGTGSQNDYFSGIEAARGQAFPEELYDYSTQVMTDYVARWAQHSSRIEQFGQKLGENSKTLWDRSRESTRDRRTIDYITAAQERVEGYYPNDPIVKGMATLNIWSSGLQLGNPASSMLNFFGGTTLNAMVGQPGALSSYVSSFAELRKLGRELKDAREKGIVSRDLMNIVGDHQVVLDSSGLAKAGQKTSDFLLKWSGFTPVEQMVRTQSMIIGKSFLRKTLSSLSKNPNSSFSKQALTWLNRNNIDADKLIVEQGTGPETDRLLRYFANISQGSYTISQTPIFTDTPIGRFLFKYQKFSTQVMRQSWKNTFEPAWKAVTNKNETLQLPDQTRQLLYRLRLAEAKELGDNRKITLDEIPKKVTKAEGKALTIIPVMMWLGASYVGGEVILRLRDMLFGVLMKGPDYEDIIKAFEDDEDDDELYLSLERAWYNLIGMGALGLIGNYAQFFMDWQDRERVKNPLDPPALSIFKETATFIQNAVDQGKITVGDVNNYLNRTFSAYRVSQRLYQTAASGLGYSDAPTVAEEMFRREVASINKYARRWASSAGLEYRTKRPMDIAPSKMTPINREIANYLQRGEPGAAAAYAKEYLKSLPKSERANAIQSMESGARNRQPLRLGSGPMDQAEKTAFKKWLKEKVSKEKFDEIQKLESQYQKNYNIFLNNLPNK